MSKESGDKFVDKLLASSKNALITIYYEIVNKSIDCVSGWRGKRTGSGRREGYQVDFSQDSW